MLLDSGFAGAPRNDERIFNIPGLYSIRRLAPRITLLHLSDSDWM